MTARRPRKPRARAEFLHWQFRPSKQDWAAHWKPSPRLRKLGFTNRFLGTHEEEKGVLARALDLNREVAEIDAVPSRAAPRAARYRFTDLVTAYQASPAYLTDIAPATRREYKVRLRQLEAWARDQRGQSLFCDELDGQMVHDLRDALLQSGGSRHVAGALLRVLRMVCNWGVPRYLKVNPTQGVAIPTAPSRRTKLDWRAVIDMTDGCEDPVTARILRIAFWSMQRREDLCTLNRFAWREMHGLDPRDRPHLVGPGGKVMGFRLAQHKTGREVDCPMPPFLHAEIETAFSASQWLFPHSQDPAKRMTGDVMRRRVKPVLIAGGFPDHQLRDFRRSGMSECKDLGARESDIFAISGHPLLGQARSMGDVYMPPDTRSACAAIAAACRTLKELQERKAE
jgi:hypothetical protein